MLSSRSPYAKQLADIRALLGRPHPGESVWIGDCSIGVLEGYAQQMPGVALLSFGGSSIKEWYYLMKNYGEQFRDARSVSIVTSHAFRFSYWPLDYTSFLPVLMTWSDIWRYGVVQGKLSLPETMRFYLAKAFDTYAASQSFRYRAFDTTMPNYRAWYEMRNHYLEFQREKNWRGQTTAREAIQGPEDPKESYPLLSAINHSLNDRMVFMLAPRKSTKVDEKFKGERAEWLAWCRQLNPSRSCLDMSESMPDTDFLPGGDDLHLSTPEGRQGFLKLIEAKLKAPPYSAPASSH